MRNKPKTIGYMHVLQGQIASWCERDGRIYIGGRAVELEPDLKTLRAHQSADVRTLGFSEGGYGYRRVVA